MKRLVYSTPVPTEADLVARVAAAALFITHTPGIFKLRGNHWYADAIFVWKSMAESLNNACNAQCLSSFRSTLHAFTTPL